MIDHRLLTLRQMIKHVRNITDIDCMYYDPAVRFSGLNMNVSAIGMSVSIDSSRTSSKVLKMCLNDERLRSDIINDLDVREDLAQTIRNLHQFDENYIGFDGEQAFMQQHYSEYAQQLIAVYSAGNFDYTDVEESLSYLIVKSMSFDNKPSDYAQMVSSGLNGSKRNSLKHRLVRDAYEYTVATKKETKLIECLMENLGLDAGHEDLIEMPSAFH